MEDLLQYLRRKNGNRAGILLARKVTKNKKSKVLVTWSKCKLKTDKFDVTLGKEIAIGRLNKRLENGMKAKSEVPHSIKQNVQEFVERAKKYYKLKNVKVV